ncbi:CpaF family protein [Chengkuizengella axinellae]|uniref:CpaF family protein n=1 Tax=Chengkuizengella axinellae TaxID=3064388 RepID=A0ABT9IZ79_9BACL|nr:CpaF family protein [Chengkuizengella sp. 2205SS18-9]MDP5274095.1 CpaF family protein [Chengkuizengella sp. 2205SS18-9]
MDLQLLEKIKQKVVIQLNFSEDTSDDQLKQIIEEEVFKHSEQFYLTSSQKYEYVMRVFHSFRGLDILQPIVDDPSITEIMINNFDEIFIEKGGKVTLYDERFESQEKLEDVIQAVVAQVDRAVNESSPIVDARLKDGSRVNVVLPPVALKGPTMTIRKFPDEPLSIERLISIETISQEAAEFLKKLVVSKYNIFIGGGTGSGKTTFLNVLSDFIPNDERIITIEDSAELQIRNIPNLVSLETRTANTEGKGEISIRELIRSSLRMRPNRIIVGEVRGVEALDMLQAMNTGHDGSLSTGHANSTKDMLSRLETMVLNGTNLPVEVVRKQISSALDIMIHLSRMRDGSRKILEICEVTGVRGGDIQLNQLYHFIEHGEKEDGRIKGELHPTGSSLKNRQKFKMAGY